MAIKILLTLEMSRNKFKTIQLEIEDFRKQKKKNITTKKEDDLMFKFFLKSLIMVQFTKGSTTMKYKTDFDNELKEVDFLQNSYSQRLYLNVPETENVRSVNLRNIFEILGKLIPLMPNDQREF